MSITPSPQTVTQGQHSASQTDWWAVAVLAGSLLALALALWWLRRCDGPDSDSGWGGGSGREPPEPPPSPAGPAWWPEFERQFAQYVAARARSSARPLVHNERAPARSPPLKRRANRRAACPRGIRVPGSSAPRRYARRTVSSA